MRNSTHVKRPAIHASIHYGLLMIALRKKLQFTQAFTLSLENDSKNLTSGAGMKWLDRIDRTLLAQLQLDAETPIAQLADMVSLSVTPCWRRIQRLKDNGYIYKQVALVNPCKVNVGITVFISIKTNQHNIGWFERFHETVVQIPEVMEFYRMSGDIDYLLRVVVPSISAYDAVYKRLIQNTQLFDVSSSFAMEEIKFTTALPLDYAREN
jgi:Lrp/AsnC family transcriptional regulator